MEQPKPASASAYELQVLVEITRPTLDSEGSVIESQSLGHKWIPKTEEEQYPLHTLRPDGTMAVAPSTRYMDEHHIDIGIRRRRIEPLPDPDE